MSKIEYRVENKYVVSDSDLIILENRLKNIMDVDMHQDGDCYQIKTLYFDDIFNSCLESNDSGVDYRKKYRIRTYGTDRKVINFEIKEKRNGFTKKSVCPLTEDEYNKILNGDINLCDDRKPINELFLQMRFNVMEPKIIIGYERTAFVYNSGNVRITIDRNIKVSRECSSFLDEKTSGFVSVMPAGNHILEVKYDEFLPDIIAKQLEIKKLRQTAFSKYYLGRSFVNF